MNRKTIVSIFAVGAVALSALFGAISYRTASAATPTTTTTTSADSAGAAGMKGGRHGNVSNAQLASALGITEEALTTAYQTANTDALKLAVEKGVITQAQSDSIASRETLQGLGGREASALKAAGIDYDALLAKALNISVEKLSAARLTAFTAAIDAAVADGSMTQAQADLEKGEYALRNSTEFQNALQSAYENAVKEAVASGVLTQAQADAILAKRASAGFDFGMDAFGGRGGHGGHGGHGGNGAQSGTDSPAQTTTP